MIRELRIRNYSPRTIKTYVSLLSKLAQFHNTSPEVLTSEQIKQYLQQRVEKDKISVSTINQTIGALKILHQDVLGRDWEQIKVKRPRKEKRLPVIFSKQEVLNHWGYPNVRIFRHISSLPQKEPAYPLCRFPD